MVVEHADAGGERDERVLRGDRGVVQARIILSHALVTAYRYRENGRPLRAYCENTNLHCLGRRSYTCFHTTVKAP